MTTEGQVIRHAPWAWRLRARLCRIGLHFMVWHHDIDGFRCACGQQFLYAEQIRP